MMNVHEYFSLLCGCYFYFCAGVTSMCVRYVSGYNMYWGVISGWVHVCVRVKSALAVHLTSLLKAFIIHGRVPYFLLICTLLPLVKDNLANITSSDNYRAIASGSLLLKLLDTLIIVLEGEKLSCGKLQFGFQAGSSASMCT